MVRERPFGFCHSEGFERAHGDFVLRTSGGSLCFFSAFVEFITFHLYGIDRVDKVENTRIKSVSLGNYCLEKKKDRGTAPCSEPNA